LPGAKQPLCADFFRVTKVDAVSEADIVRARRDQALVHPVVAEVAFPGNSSADIVGDGLVWAGVDTLFASVTSVMVHDHDAVFSLGYGPFGAGIGAGGRVTMQAQPDTVHEIDRAVAGDMRAVFPDGDEFHPIAGVHLLLAGHLAGPASPARFVIDEQGVSFHEQLPSLSLGIDFAEQGSYMGCAHGRIAVVVVVPREDIDI
jgi:hypothetical protein